MLDVCLEITALKKETAGTTKIRVVSPCSQRTGLELEYLYAEESRLTRGFSLSNK